jgi:hypothetical protein
MSEEEVKKIIFGIAIAIMVAMMFAFSMITG